MRQMSEEQIPLPVIAIGGIGMKDAAPLLEAGLHGIAFSGMMVHAGDRSGLELSMLTADGQYAGFVESPASPPQVLTTYVDPHPQAGGPVTVDGSVVSRWEAWTDTGGDSALVAQRGHGSSQGSLLVFGTVPRAQLMQLAASLTTTRVSG